MDRWKVQIEAWPHSTGSGIEKDQKQVGERVQIYCVRAIDIADALKCAELIAQGMRSNPMVWRAPITEIVKDSTCR